MAAGRSPVASVSNGIAYTVVLCGDHMRPNDTLFTILQDLQTVIYGTYSEIKGQSSKQKYEVEKKKLL